MAEDRWAENNWAQPLPAETGPLGYRMNGAGRPWLALVESDLAGSGRQLCAAASARGLRPVVLTADPVRYPYLALDRVAQRIVDTASLNGLLAACQLLASGSGLSGIAAVSSEHVEIAARAARQLGLPAPDPAALARCRRRDRQRAALAAAGVAVPRWQAARTPAEAAETARAIGLPVVVKPLVADGPANTRLCQDAAEVSAHAADLFRAQPGHEETSESTGILVEEQATGPWLSVGTFDGEVIGVAARHLGPPPYQVEVGHDLPAPIPAAAGRALGETALRALEALGLGWGAAQTDLWLTPQGPVVIEVSPALMDATTLIMIRLAAGVDLADALIARSTGHRPKLSPASLAHTSVRYVFATVSDTVQVVTGLDAARCAPGVAMAQMMNSLDAQAADPARPFRDRLAYVIAVGQDADSAASNAEHAASLVHIHVR
jgi:biotin carboxylase